MISLPTYGELLSEAKKDMNLFLKHYINITQARRWADTGESDDDDNDDDDMTYLEQRSLEGDPPTVEQLGQSLYFFQPEAALRFLNRSEIQSAFQRTYLEPVLLKGDFGSLPIDMVPVLLVFDSMHESLRPHEYLQSEIAMDPKGSDARVVEFIIEVVLFIMSDECQEEFGWEIIDPLVLATRDLVYIAAMMIDLLARQALGVDLDLELYDGGTRAPVGTPIHLW
ncbi:uncharacterized protein F4817DRAFT_347485 [Daldinia loculata]|uniref:uncharacterized protein n=1 Tax=Daldinia loculata TaxID=103429 RepID=UPI0020C3453B|nr:uncharacterized protein F4817DRAFT_347485 [Daldinia loculata]KAI1644178.1 hypothetical protein F4817DRAFT_347485 [Daldinia loculata]